MKRLVIWTLLSLTACAVAQQPITVRKVGTDSFTATLRARETLSISAAQARMEAVIAQACKGMHSLLGKYTFSSSNAISGPTEPDDSFEFNQDFTCTASVPGAEKSAQPTVITDAEKAQLVELVEKETAKWLARTDDNGIREFHSRFSLELAANLPLTAWTEQQTDIHKRAGPIKETPLLKATTYVDPPDSDGPGTYVAVDFQAAYEHAPFRCGYLMWLLDPRSKLSVIRVENGIAYSEDVASLSVEEVEAAKKQFRCFSP